MVQMCTTENDSILKSCNQPSFSEAAPTEIDQPKKALHEHFNQDVFFNTSTPTDNRENESTQSTTDSSSVIQTVLGWFKRDAKKTAIPVKNLEKQEKARDSVAELKGEPLSPIPMLDHPENIPAEELSIQLPITLKPHAKGSSFNLNEFENHLSSISGETIESIMFIIFQTQIELEKEHAKVAESTYSKFLNFQKLQQQMLSEIKDVLVNDQTIAKNFEVTHNIATFIAGAASIAIAFGFLNPFLSFLSTAAVATLTASTGGAKAYFQRQMTDNKASREKHTYKDDYYNNRLEDSRHRLITTAESDTAFKERWIKFLRRTDDMRKIILKKAENGRK